GVASTLQSLHDGLAKACQDPAIKAMIPSVDTIVYVPTGDTTYALDAAIVGSTLTLTDYVFGSTRHRDDYATAIGHAKPPEAPKATGPVKLGTPSRKWDATYHDDGGPETT